MNTLAKSIEWHAERARGIGGSDAGRIMAGDWLALWNEKTGRVESEDLSNVLQVQLGTFTEAFNLAWLARQTGLPVSHDDCDALVHPSYEFMRCNLDGRTTGAILEAKHVSAFAKDEEIVSRYLPQLQHCMAVSGAPLAKLSVIFGNHKWAVFDVAADADYQRDLIAREAEFWRHVEMDLAPDNQAAIVAAVSFDDMREADMTGNNAWASGAADWLANRDAARAFDGAVKSVKEMVEPDVKLAHGHGIKVSRSKAGALTIRESK